ncbi:AAA domain protein, partial [Vibrio parahaemolyticus V-223/04]
SCSV